MDYSNIFTARAEHYSNAQKACPNIRQAELECFMRLLDIQPGESFLDAPAGNGVASRYMPPGGIYQALDPAPGFVMQCREQGLPTVCAPLRSSGLDADQFDVIGSLTGVHHERYREEIFSEWFRLLKPGGRLLVMDVADRSSVGDFLNGFVDRWNTQGHCGVFLNRTDEEALHLLGYVQIKSTGCAYDWRAENETQMLAFMQGLFGLDKQPPAELMLHELAAVLGAARDAKGYRVPWSLAALSARKPKELR